MNLHIGRSTGITLLLAAAVFVVLMAVVSSFSFGVGADGCETGLTPNDMHEDLNGVVCGETGHDDERTHARISTDVPGAAVEITLQVTAETAIEVGDKITVDLSGPSADSGFILTPASLKKENIKIQGVASTAVEVQGEKVILTSPPTVQANNGTDYTIAFEKPTIGASGIKNPYYAGNRVITVWSSGPDGVGRKNETEITAVIRRVTTITPSEGPRGSDFTLTGKGYAKGTVAIFDGGDDTVDDGEILETVETGTATSGRNLRGTFTVDLTVRGTPPGLKYRVRTIDSEGQIDYADFTIASAMTFEPATAVVGLPLTIKILDWQYGGQKVASVRIAGEQAYIAGVAEYRTIGSSTCYEYTGLEEADDDGVVSLEVLVPEDILPGEQTVAVYTEDQLKIRGENSISACMPPQTGESIESDLEAELRENATPIIQRTVEIVSGLPPVALRGQNIVRVDGGRDQEVVLNVRPPDSDRSRYLGAGDQIEITMPGFDLSGAAFDPHGARERIKIHSSEETIADAVTPTRVSVDALAGTITLTIPAIKHGAGGYLAITIQEGSGILTPDVPRGFDDPDEGYKVAITLVDKHDEPSKTHLATDENIAVVKNPISSSVPSATVRVTLVAYAEVQIGTGEEIEVDFSGPSADSEFVVPSSMTKTRITIRSGNQSFSPSEVQVQGARVILTIPSGDDPEDIVRGEFTIVFSNLARIKNPFAAGNRVIRVSSFVEGDLPDEIIAVIKRTTTIDPLEGPRGSEFELEGKGYARGTVTIYHDADGDGQIDAGETLDSVKTVRGAFSIDLVARGKPGDLVYPVRTRDSEGVEEEVGFDIRSGIFFEPSTARVGRPLKITITDWLDAEREVAAVRIGGEDTYVAGVREYENCFDYTGEFRADRDLVVSFEVEVPRHVPAGEQTVALYDHGQLDHFRTVNGTRTMLADKGPCADLRESEGRGSSAGGNVVAQVKAEPIATAKATIEVNTQDLDLIPSSAVRGQRVTILGSGFTRAVRGSDHIDSVWIGGKRVVDDHSGLEVGSNGDIAIAVTVPLAVADGLNEVRIEGTDHTLGQATLTVPAAVITVEPAQGQRGTDFTITGSGFIAREPVLVSYGPEEGASSEAAPLAGSARLADPQGEFELTFRVPVIANVGKRYKIEAISEVDSLGVEVLVEAEATHFIPRAVITTSPESLTPGDHLTIRGQHLPPFTLAGPIKIAGIGVVPSSEIATDKNGDFEAEVLIPHIEYGDQTLLIHVAGTIIPSIINVAPPPFSGPPGQVFKLLIRAGALSLVWRYDNAMQEWGLFDPSLSEELAELNDLSEVGSGDILWVSLTKPLRFQGVELAEGWSLVALK